MTEWEVMSLFVVAAECRKADTNMGYLITLNFSDPSYSIAQKLIYITPTYGSSSLLSSSSSFSFSSSFCLADLANANSLHFPHRSSTSQHHPPPTDQQRGLRRNVQTGPHPAAASQQTVKTPTIHYLQPSSQTKPSLPCSHTQSQYPPPFSARHPHPADPSRNP